MIDLKLLDRFQDQNLEEGIDVLNDLYWFITTEYHDNNWYVHSGHVLLFKTDSEEAYKAFLYGLGITYVMYEHEILDVMHDEIKKWTE